MPYSTRGSRTLLSVGALALLGILAAGCASTPRPPANVTPVDERARIRDVLLQQVEAWNQGDVEGFMRGYAQVDSLRFASGGSVRRGWERALEEYRQGYPDRSAMGTLAFENVDIWMLSDEEALVFGEWWLLRTPGTPNGLFTLLMVKAPTEDGTNWRIVHDHTSAAAPEEQ